ncbi:MAG TPA: hypothetical protein VHX11_13060 [Acidobacteriaceae bacterium]|jgi:homoserine kinase type II|nr:hypothetical protein [Acidobacteriaceae bacterium]
MMEKIYLLWFVQEHQGEPDTELLIGVFASETEAERAIEQLKSKPGFCVYPDGFRIHSQQIGQIGWSEGFVEDQLAKKS